MSKTYGTKLKLSVFGASHAPFIGAALQGLPKGYKIDPEAVDRFMERRAPGRNAVSTARREPDKPIFVTGIRDGRLTGGPLEIRINNTDTRSSDYSEFNDRPRPGHADFCARVKYGDGYDVAGGGSFSGRMTAPICCAGAVAVQLLAAKGIRVGAHIASVAGIKDKAFDLAKVTSRGFARIANKEIPVLDDEAGEKMKEAILSAKREGDSVGGVIECAVTGLPVGLGGPLFDGMEGRISEIVFAVPAVKGIEFGAGFGAALLRGSEDNDPFCIEKGKVRTATNNHGGILGGITSGMPLVFRCAVKPTPTIAKEQDTVSLSAMEAAKIRGRGRHDPCVVPRAVPVIEAAAALAVLDVLLEENKF